MVTIEMSGPIWHEAIMQKDELLSHVNAISVPKFGKKVEPRMLSDWVNEELVSKAIPHGRLKGGGGQNWEWTARHIEEILHVCQIMGYAKKPFSYVRVALWFSGKEISTDLITQALAAEFKRVRKKRMKNVTVGFDLQKGRDMLPAQKKRLAAQIGNIPTNLHYPNIFPSEDDKIKALQMMATEDVSPNFDQMISNFFNALEIPADEMRKEFNFEELCKAAMAGLYADTLSYEKTAETDILNATREQLLAAREFQRLCILALENVGNLLHNNQVISPNAIDKFELTFGSVTPNLKEWRGRLELFASILMLIQRRPELVQQIQSRIQPHI